MTKCQNFVTINSRYCTGTACKEIVTTSVGDLFPFPKRQIVNFVVRTVKKMVPAYSLPQAVGFRDALEAGKRASFKPVEIRNTDIAFLQYTGGTTGVAKGAELTHRNLVANITQISAWISATFKEGEEVVMTALPLYHIFSLAATLVFTHWCSTMVLITNPRDIDGLAKECVKWDFSVIIGPNGTGVSFHVERWHPSLVRSNPSLQLAEQIVVLLSGSFHFKEHSIMISLPWPALSGAGPKTGYGAVLFIRTEKDFPVPAYLDAFSDVIVMDDSQLTGTLNLPANITQIAYDDSQKRERGTLALNLLHSHQATRDLPFLCTNLSAFGSDLWSGLCASQQLSGSPGGTGIFCLGALPEGLERLDAYCRHESFNTLDELFAAIDAPPAFIILNRCSPDDISRIRYGKLSSSSPVLIVKDSFTEEEVQAIEEFPSVLICNSGICTSDEFLSRLVGIFAGNPVLPPLTGALVKRAIVYLNSKARSHISRWKIADSVNIDRQVGQ